eukprot:43255-Eustigmatos_ZCMA.PRE.1
MLKKEKHTQKLGWLSLFGTCEHVSHSGYAASAQGTTDHLPAHLSNVLWSLCAPRLLPARDASPTQASRRSGCT